MQDKIIQLGDPVLRQNARMLSLDEIKKSSTQNLIEVMKEVMRKAPGVGLAAPQIGISRQLAVIEDTEERRLGMDSQFLQERGIKPIKFHVIINPVITTISKAKKLFFESCLSVCGKSRVTPRAESVEVKCLDEKGNERIIKASGWYARILQHEIDHLNGNLYIDIADKRTELINDDPNSQVLLKASEKEIKRFYDLSLMNNLF